MPMNDCEFGHHGFRSLGSQLHCEMSCVCSPTRITRMHAFAIRSLVANAHRRTVLDLAPAEVTATLRY